MSAFTITPCTTGDIKTLAGVATQSYREVYPYLWHDRGEWYIKQCFEERVLSRELKQPDQKWFLLKENDVAVGYLKLNLDKSPEDYEAFKCLELERVYLINDAKGKGYGRQAVEFSEKYARNLKKDIIWLRAMDSTENPAFYENLGFKICGTYRLPFELLKDELRGMVIMIKWLR